MSLTPQQTRQVCDVGRQQEHLLDACPHDSFTTALSFVTRGVLLYFFAIALVLAVPGAVVLLSGRAKDLGESFRLLSKELGEFRRIRQHVER